MKLDFFYNVFTDKINDKAIIYKGIEITYRSLLSNIDGWKKEISNSNIIQGEVVALIGDFTPNTIAILFALIENNNIIVPFDLPQKDLIDKKMQIAGVSKVANIDEKDNVCFSNYESNLVHPFYSKLIDENKPGLVLFTSGTSGEPKAAVHDLTMLLEKFRVRKRTFRTLNFLLFDHWGGLNTMFHTLSNGGVVLALNDRKPKNICSFIEQHRIELLPASPTFLNLLIISEEYKNYDLSSLILITYGTEPMPESTLKRVKSIFPNIKLQQTYGLIELGVLRSKSKSDDSLWVQIGGEGYQTRVVDGLLEIKAESAMLGYLNAPSPFTEDGWFMTGDQVEVEGEYLKILGRKSEIINVGGEKVYPAEVESVIQEMDNVLEVPVFGEKNPIMGNIVSAKVRLKQTEDKKEFTNRLKLFCKLRLQSFKIPVKVYIEDSIQYNERFKKTRFNNLNN